MHSEKVNTVGVQGSTTRAYESDLEEVAKYIDYELAGIQANGKGN